MLPKGNQKISTQPNFEISNYKNKESVQLYAHQKVWKIILYSLKVNLFRYNQHPKISVIFVRRTKKAPKNPWLIFLHKIRPYSGVDDAIFYKIDYKIDFI